MGFFFDLFYILKGKYLKKTSNEYKFAFLVHSRGYKDIYRKYPKLKIVPKSILAFLMKNLWPITLSQVTGVVNTKTGENIKGYVLGITMTAGQMMKDREAALSKIRQSLYLARGKGVKIIGLGGLTSSLSGGGSELLDIEINITTGHAYTAFNITQNLFKLNEIFDISMEKVKVGVVGAAGSVGSMSAVLVGRKGFNNIRLIDLERKKKHLFELQKNILEVNSNANIEISYLVSDISDCDYVITATNTPEALITVDIVKDGMVIIDDAQPSDIHPDVLKLKNVLVVEAGVVHTPGINSNFNYGLKSRTDNFCCMAELLILASHEWKQHYVIHRATLKHIDEISDMGNKLGFEVAAFQNFLESISYEKIENVKTIIRKKHDL